ncbi:MAG: rod shape-determining protein MreC [Campylobacterota bacterium]|nr:rod shape-determining protein MreC [Campylobacterota bacterium]
MNKGLYSFLFIFITLFVGAIYYSNTIQTPIIHTLNLIKLNFHKSIDFFENKIEKHTFQASKIEELKEELQKYEKNHLIMQELASELNDLFNKSNSPLKVNPNVELVRTISYKKFGDFNKIWLDVKEYNSSKIYGLTYKELVAGIVIPKNNKPLGLLNKDIKSTYAVYIGQDKAPGIAHGYNSEHLIIKFIPAWFKIKKDDAVITSGLDKIFFKGLKVGRVVSVSSSQGYQNAIVEPYYKANNPNYFYIIKKIR